MPFIKPSISKVFIGIVLFVVLYLIMISLQSKVCTNIINMTIDALDTKAVAPPAFCQVFQLKYFSLYFSLTLLCIAYVISCTIFTLLNKLNEKNI